MMNFDPNNETINTTGVAGGEEVVALIPGAIPPHSHSFNIATAPDTVAVNGAAIAQSVAMPTGTVLSFSDLAVPAKLSNHTLGNSGNSAPHENRMPSLALTVCIAANEMADTGESYYGEIRPFAFKECPEGWLACDGSILQVDVDNALASLLGNTFGGDGQTTFALPDLRGRVAVATGQVVGMSNYALGETFGSESVSLSADEMPEHNHQVVLCNDTAVSATVQGQYAYLAARECPVEGSLNSFIPASKNMETQTLDAATIGMGKGNPHENRQPYMAINYLIANSGFYPPKS